jgi:hypothetical protein
LSSAASLYMKFLLENHSGDVNIDSGPAGFSIHSGPESIFTSRRNPYSHHSGTIIHMPRNPQAYDWPGNIRELENLTGLRSGAVPGNYIDAPLSAAGAGSSDAPPLSMEHAERRHIENALASALWVLEGPKGARPLCLA